jgi:peptide-methionine (S)-S-oxide reductase
MRTLALAVSLAAGLCLTQASAEEVVVAGGCFWCVEADFERVQGVTEAISGYTGGTTVNPTYREVTGGDTGHYEAVRIEFDASRVSARQLYDLFFRSIDPTDAGGQFCDRGDSYRTAIFVGSDADRRAAEAAKAKAEADLGQTIVTPILPLSDFYEAEDYHQDYAYGTNRVLTRFGWITQADAYKRYREACGRDQRVRELWGDAAPFTG